jgi:hypothetical protein
MLRALQVKYRKLPFSTSHRTKSPELIKFKTRVIDNVIKATNNVELHHSRLLGVASPRMGELRTGEFFNFLVVSRTQRTGDATGRALNPRKLLYNTQGLTRITC